MPSTPDKGPARREWDDQLALWMELRHAGHEVWHVVAEVVRREGGEYLMVTYCGHVGGMLDPDGEWYLPTKATAREVKATGRRCRECCAALRNPPPAKSNFTRFA